MLMLEIPPDVTANVTIPHDKKTFLYKCGCSTHNLTIRQHNKAKYGLYNCKICKQQLK